MRFLYRVLYRLPLSALCVVGLAVLHIMHIIIHNTPLDSGALDAGFMHMNLLLTSNINTER